MASNTNKQNKRRYTTENVKEALRRIKEDGWTVYKAGKQYGVPWSTLKDKANKFVDNPYGAILSKPGKHFVMPAELEIKMVNYITSMQDMGFYLTVNQVRTVAFRVIEAAGIKHPFNRKSKMAGWYWCDRFKQRYNLTLKTPEIEVLDRADLTKSAVLEDFFDKVESLLNRLGIADKASRVWNCDEIGLSYTLRSGKAVCLVDKKSLYNQGFGEKEQTTTLLCCINASGMDISPVIILNDTLAESHMPNLVRFSPSGWTNYDIFQEWFQHFIQSIPPARPVVLFMDSHASYVTPEVLSMASDNDVHIVTFPSQTSYYLHPINVMVHKALKECWSRIFSTFIAHNPDQKPDCYNFIETVTVAYRETFQATTVRNSFSMTGIFPLNRYKVSAEPIAHCIVTGYNTQQVGDDALVDSKTTLEKPRSDTTSKVILKISMKINK
ncbi:hypothetical protein C0J52_23828 [Blattella germanica]|nr:hypothetical protein C0J52_23828 [Blattella germanica]